MEKSKWGLSAVGALLAAIFGGAVWATIAIVTDYELGLIAWGIGGLTGYVVVYLANKQTNVIHQVIAVVASLLGILLGKFFIVSYLINDGFAGMFDSYSFTYFQVNLTDMFSGMDIIFVLLAIATAWKMPARMGSTTQSGEQNVTEQR